MKEVKDFFLGQLRKSGKNGTRISIKRKRHFAGSFIPYNCVFGVEKDIFLEYCKEMYRGDEEDDEDEENQHLTTFDSMKMLVENGSIKRIVRIFNGKTIVMNLADEELSFFAYVESNPEFAFSNQIKLQPGETCDFEIKTSYHWVKGMSLSIERK